MSIQRTSFYVLLAFVTVAFLWLVLPYYGAVLWAVILATIFFPVHRRLERTLNGRGGIAALLTVLLCICLVILPAMLILGSLIREGTSLYQRISSNEIDLSAYLVRIQDALPQFADNWLNSVKLGGFAELREKLFTGFMQTGQSIVGSVINLGQNTLKLFINFGIMLYLLFFLFRDGAQIGETVRNAIPLSDDYTRQFVENFSAVVRAIIKGNVIIALIQGAVGGIAFWALGIEAALLWGVMMTFLSMLPAIGTAFVWVPAAIWLFLTGAWVKGLTLVLVGVLIIGLIDNLLRPQLIGKETRLPDYLILISTVGGISLIGINGFVVGPLIAALFIAAWSLFVQQQNTRKPEPTDTNAV
ncbi:putative PurR-regulated permease PerM [Agrobacterium tumefaciens]|uniref:PurR-regulated permease PerM n=1 Tax=Agrobacterium radiobacter TaxID=362 RepID=A0ABR6JEP0_AGRRD|nr:MULTISPECIES: AI-2E family transporter [Agrobacterium tumefaciens complex]MBB4321477.1 putative PurR-regulated permease PerM [Agrobacterium radiobacter]MBB4338458.1 putative PurR-regulated permease PerM [Agrobacterium radiobacter]MBB4493404.1 putative PurR-regulated permease PerM [Agrobacterium radiobacter]MBB4498617.1 putative PurR-regulated permease PerM [Agrobacterium radiobacter]MBB4503991.1 putative PurR-regulated permease PerM [Agrobacterium radiobacter]